jgi:hypothetical protein
VRQDNGLPCSRIHNRQWINLPGLDGDLVQFRQAHLVMETGHKVLSYPAGTGFECVLHNRASKKQTVPDDTTAHEIVCHSQILDSTVITGSDLPPGANRIVNVL